MSDYLICEINCQTGEVIEREMTADEANQRALDNAAYAQAKIDEAQKETAKAELLSKLGITAEEAKLLLS
jgi:hypothetical protein